MIEDFKNTICSIEEDDRKITWRSDDSHFETYNVLKSEKDLLNKIKPYLKDNKIMVQAGGNCGLQIEKFAEHFDTVYTFEPDPINFYCLVNNLTMMNVVKLQACVGKEKGTVSMNFFPNIGGFNVGNKSGPFPVILIDDLLLPHCNLIQLDVEGYEMNALLGSLETIKKYKPVVCLEIYENWLNRYGHSSHEIFEFMKSLDYLIVDTYVTDVIFVHRDNA